MHQGRFDRIHQSLQEARRALRGLAHATASVPYEERPDSLLPLLAEVERLEAFLGELEPLLLARAGELRAREAEARARLLLEKAERDEATPSEVWELYFLSEPEARQRYRYSADLAAALAAPWLAEWFPRKVDLSVLDE